MGSHPKKAKALERPPASANRSRSIVGNWLDETPFTLVRGMTIYREKGKLYMDQRFEDGSGGPVELVQIRHRFKEKGKQDSEDYYVIDAHGNLQLRDQEGLITTAKKVGQ